MSFVTIDDPTDVRLDDYRNVPDGELVSRRGVFVAEGRLVVERLVTERRFATRSVLVTETARAALADVFATRSDVPVYVVPPSLMNTITGLNIHRGCLAIGVRGAPARWQDVAGSFRLKAEATSTEAEATPIVVLERIANADNVGGVFRNAAAFRAGAVLLDGASTDPLYRKAIRTSMAATLRVPFARAEPWREALHELRREGFVLLAMTLAADAPSLRACAERLSGQRVAVVLGHEGDGLSAATLEACDLRARIPMASGVDSINVASAAAIALYELRRT